MDRLRLRATGRTGAFMRRVLRFEGLSVSVSTSSSLEKSSAPVWKSSVSVARSLAVSKAASSLVSLAVSKRSLPPVGVPNLADDREAGEVGGELAVSG